MYSVAVDVALVLCLAAAVVYALLRARRIAWNIQALAIGVTLLLFYVIAPREMFTGSPVDGRFVWPACILLCLAVQPALSLRQGALAMAAIVSVFVARTEIIAHEWRALDHEIAKLVRVFDALPRDSRLYPVFVTGGSADAVKREGELRHVPCYAVLLRDAYVPTLLAIRGQQPVVAKHEEPRYDWRSGAGDLTGFDYVWAYNLPRAGAANLAKIADEVRRVDESGLWKLRGGIVPR